VVTNPTIFNRATTKLPNVFSHKDNNKLSVPSFDLIPIPAATLKTETNHRDHRKTIRARSDLLQLLRDHLSTTQINDAHHLLHRARPTNTNETTAHLSDQRRIQINDHHPMDLTSINRATLHPTPLPSSAITADASATIRATVPTQDPTKTIAHPTRNVQPTMKTLLLEINNALTLLLTLVKTPKIIQDTITKLSKLPPLINLMINKTTSHGPIPLYLRCLSINLYLIEIIFQLPTMLLPTLEPQLISLMIPNHHTKDLVPHSLQTGYLTVVLPVIILHSSATSVMLNLAVSQSP